MGSVNSSPTFVSACPETEVRAAALCWHIITSEYPPQRGGVSDYTSLVAGGLGAEGDQVHVWCPASTGQTPELQNVHVHRDLGAMRPEDMRRVGKQLDAFTGPRRILVQWVPHGYGYHSMNLPFCWWLRRRVTKHGDRLEIMLHEPFLSFRLGAWRQSLAALVHRLMTLVLLGSAERVWMSIPAWEKRWKPYALGRPIPFRWLPVPSNIPIENNRARIQAVRERYAEDGEVLIGHFGTYGQAITSVLEPVLLALGQDPGRQKVLLMGHGSEAYRSALMGKNPRLAGVLHATGALGASDVSCHVAACSMLIQPFPDGVSTRRTSFMVGLSHGKPVITNVGPLSESFWSESGAVGLAATGDANSWLGLVQKLGADAVERERMGRSARELYQGRFDISHAVGALRNPDSTELSSCGS